MELLVAVPLVVASLPFVFLICGGKSAKIEPPRSPKKVQSVRTVDLNPPVKKATPAPAPAPAGVPACIPTPSKETTPVPEPKKDEKKEEKKEEKKDEKKEEKKDQKKEEKKGDNKKVESEKSNKSNKSAKTNKDKVSVRERQSQLQKADDGEDKPDKLPDGPVDDNNEYEQCPPMTPEELEKVANSKA